MKLSPEQLAEILGRSDRVRAHRERWQHGVLLHERAAYRVDLVQFIEDTAAECDDIRDAVTDLAEARAALEAARDALDRAKTDTPTYYERAMSALIAVRSALEVTPCPD